jgi:hypothetical protein
MLKWTGGKWGQEQGDQVGRIKEPGLIEEMWGKTDGTEGHLRDGMETSCIGNVLKYGKVILNHAS